MEISQWGIESKYFSQTRRIWKMLGPFATASRRTRLFYIAIHQVSLLSHTATVTCRLRIDVHNDNDNAWQRGQLWPQRMGPIISIYRVII